MACVSWVLVTAAVFASSPVVGALGWDTSLCDDLSSKDRLLDCIHRCTSTLQAKLPELSSVAQRSSEDDLTLDLLLANLASGGDKILEPEPAALDEKRRSYSMEHFRWGKPAGRKRRPVKVYAYAPEDDDDSSEGSVPRQERRQLGSADDRGARGGTDLRRAGGQEEVAQTWGKFEPRLAPPPGPQDKKDGGYKMGHFRWGRPPAKRYGGFMKPHKSILNLLRNVMVKEAK